MHLYYIEVDVGKECNGMGRLGDCRVGDGECGARDGSMKVVEERHPWRTQTT